MEELDDKVLRETWIFTEKKNPDNTMSGNEEAAMEYLESLRSTSLYSHACSEGCKRKGIRTVNSFSHVNE